MRALGLLLLAAEAVEQDLLGLRFGRYGAGIVLEAGSRAAHFVGTSSTGSDGRGSVALIGAPMCNHGGAQEGVFTVAIQLGYTAQTVEIGMAGHHAGSNVVGILDSGTRVRIFLALD